MSYRRLLIFSIFGLVGFWLLFIGLLSRVAPSYLRQKAKSQGVDLTIKRAHTNYWNQIVLVGIRVHSPFQAEIPQLKFSFEPTSFLKTGQIFFLDAVHPSIVWKSFQLNNTKSRFWLRFRLRFHEGDFRGDIIRAIFAKKISGYVDFGPLGFSGQISGMVNNAGEITAYFSAPHLLKSSWNVRLKSESFELAKLSIQGLPDNIPTASFDFELDQNKIQVNSFRIHQNTNMIGVVSNPWVSPSLDLKIPSSKEMLSKWIDAERWIDGPLSLQAHITGTPKDMQVSGKYSLDATLSRMQVPRVVGGFSYANGIFKATGSVSQGAIYLESRASNSPLLNLRIKNVSIDELAQLNGWENVQGLFHSQLSWNTEKKSSAMHGEFELDNFQWGRLRPSGSRKGFLNISPTLISMRTSDDSLNIKALMTNSDIQLEKCHFLFGEISNIQLTGSVNLEARDININVIGHQIPPDIWPPLVSRFPNITGGLNFSGDVTGSIERPVAEMDLAFTKLKLIPSGEEWNGTARLEGSREKFLLKDIHVNGGYSGALSWENNQWIFDAELKQASPALIREILKKEFMVSGQASGPLHLIWDGKYLVGKSSFSWVNPQINSSRFDQVNAQVTFEKNKWDLRKMEIIKGGSAIRGEVQLHADTPGWRYNSVFQFQQWGVQPIVLDGEIRSNGRIHTNFDLEGNVDSNILWIQNNTLDNISAKIRRKGAKWALHGTAGNETRYDFKWDTNISGTFFSKAIPIEKWLETYFPNINPENKLTGKMDLSTHIQGAINNPLIKLKAQINEGSWRGQFFHSDLNLIANSTHVIIGPSIVRFREGGQLNISGDLTTVERKNIRIIGDGENIRLNSLFDFLSWSLRLDGKTNCSFSFDSKKEEDPLFIQLSGQHEGVGLFRQSGEISGTIIGDFKELDLSGLRISSGQGYAKLLKGSTVFMDKNMSGRLRLPIEARNLSAGVLTFFGNVDIAGVWENKTTSLDVFARSLWVNQYYMDGNITRLTMKKGGLSFSPIPGSGQQVSGDLDYNHFPKMSVKNFRLLESGNEKVFLNGEIGRGQWDYKLIINDIDANVICGLFDQTFSISGPMTISAIGKGTYSNPHIQAEVRWRNGQFYGIPLDTAEGTVYFRDGITTIENISALKKKGYRLKGYFRPEEVKFQVQEGDLQILPEIIPEVTKARGNFEGSVQFRNRDGRRESTGSLRVHKMLLRTEHVPLLTNGVIDLTLRENELAIREATADCGDGRVQMEGTILFDGMLPEIFNLKLNTVKDTGVLIRVPELSIKPGPVLGRLGKFGRTLSGVSQGEPKFNLQLTGTREQPKISGEIVLINTTFTYPPVGTTTKVTPFSKWAKRFLGRIDWDIHMKATTRTWYQNELVNALVTGGLRFSGKKGTLDVDGKIESEQGSLVYSGNEFSIKQATLELETKLDDIQNDMPEKKSYVYLKANAEKEVFYTDALSNTNQDTISMVVDRALLGEIQPRFISKNNPNLSSQKALQLALGLPLSGSIEDNLLLPDQRAAEQERSREETDKLLRIGLVQLIDSSLASPLARAIAQKTGLVDFIRVTYQEKDPLARDEFDSSEGAKNDITQNEFLKYAKGTKVKFGRGLSRRLFADYSFRVDEFEEKLDLRHEVELAYRLKQNFFLKGITELDSERTLGRPPDRRAILENRWRFGLPRKKKQKQSN